MKKYNFKNNIVELSHTTKESAFYIINGIIKSTEINSFFNEAKEIKEIQEKIIIPKKITKVKENKEKEPKIEESREKTITRPKTEEIKTKRKYTKKTIQTEETKAKEEVKLNNIKEINDPYEGYL